MIINYHIWNHFLQIAKLNLDLNVVTSRQLTKFPMVNTCNNIEVTSIQYYSTEQMTLL